MLTKRELWYEEVYEALESLGIYGRPLDIVQSICNSRRMGLSVEDTTKKAEREYYSTE